MTEAEVLDRALELREDVRREKRAIETHRAALRRKAAELRAICEALGFTYEEFRTEGIAHGPERAGRPN